MVENGIENFGMKGSMNLKSYVTFTETMHPGAFVAPFVATVQLGHVGVTVIRLELVAPSERLCT